MIESPFFVDNLKHLPARVLGVDPLQGIEYHLGSVLKRGSTVAVLFPKGVLAEVLPRLAKEKGLRVLVVGGPASLRRELAKNGSLEVRENVPIDLFLTEPSAFGRDGAWMHPSESSAFVGLDVVAVGSMLQWLSHTPADCDLVKVERIVSEKGVFSPELFDVEVRSILPWRVS